MKFRRTTPDVLECRDIDAALSLLKLAMEFRDGQADRPRLVQAVDKTLEAYPDSSSVRQAVATIQFDQLKDRNAAVQTLAVGMALNPGDTTYVLRLARVLAAIESKEVIDALLLRAWNASDVTPNTYTGDIEAFREKFFKVGAASERP